MVEEPSVYFEGAPEVMELSDIFVQESKGLLRRMKNTDISTSKRYVNNCKYLPTQIYMIKGSINEFKIIG